MFKRAAHLFAIAALTSTMAVAANDALWVLSDPRGDDHGDGSIKYPLSRDWDRGDLDLLSLKAYRQEGGTLFEATFARPVKTPQRTTIDGLGTTLDQIAKHGFYTINLDIYVDKDGVKGSGSRSLLPGRKAFVDESNGWEKAIALTPDPMRARAELKRIVVRDEKRKAQSEGRRGVIDDETRGELREGVDEYVFFPTNLRVLSNRIEFFVPDSFLGGPASADWSYLVVVSGADIVERTDQQNRLLRRGDPSESLMILPVVPGHPSDRFGGAKEDDDFQPPLVDIVVKAGEKQETVLKNYDGDLGTAVVLRAVKP
jgi:hypothetical protein